jgi:hypothetical protein
MADASTVDSFQGQENDIVIVIMGTKFPEPGPGFMTDPHQLNVLTRQRCGLVLGDIDIRGDGDKDGKGGKDGKGNGKSVQRLFVISVTGTKSWLAAPMLQHIYRRMVESGRRVFFEWMIGTRVPPVNQCG